MKNIWFLFAFVFLNACSQKTTTSVSTNSKTADPGKNNVIVAKETNVFKSKSGNDKIEFKGSNNIFDLVQKNAAFFDGRETVIIVQGNNNIVKLYNINVVDMSAPGMDTLLLIGNHVKYIMDISNKVVLKKKSLKADTIEMQPKHFATTDFSNELSETDHRIQSLTERLNTNDPEAFYELAKIYHYELDNKKAVLKAIELYEYAAAQNHIESIQKLGDIFANGTFDLGKDLKKAQYFFILGANLGDSYSKERLAELNLK